MSLPEKAKSFPRKPGVYLFKGVGDEVLYVGKAKVLRDRVKSYFRSGEDERPQIKFLLRRTKDIEFIVTDSEKEALLLENTLIKKHKPRYNLELRDDKSYVSIRIGAEHVSPGISITRRIKKDGALYFGPYDSSLAAREAVEQITRFFKIRTCSDREFSNRVRPCLKYDIGRCTAPCVELVANKDYAGQVEEAVMFLSGRSKELIRRLDLRMRTASGEMLYEDAARFRDAIEMLRGLTEKQKVVRHAGGDHDAVGIAMLDNRIAISVMNVRNGLLIGRRNFFTTSSPGDDAKLMEEFLLGGYQEGARIPPRILLPCRPEGMNAISDVLSDRRGKRVKISVPVKGPMLRLVTLACTNARETLLHRALRKGDEQTFERLAHKLGVGDTIDSIECVDISNLSGREAVGSIAAFIHGTPEKSNYRIYNIRTLNTPDDYGMMYEVLNRRFSEREDIYRRRAHSPRRPAPDLLLVDGGKGHLNVAVRVLGDLGLSIPIAAIAKGDGKDEPDRIFVPGRKNPLKFKKGSKELLFLMRVRDEAHRFGINAHRRKRGKKTIASPLDDIAGLGPNRRKMLIDKFGGLDEMKRADINELTSVKGITSEIAKRIKDVLTK